MSRELLAKFGRRVRVGMVGGGDGSIIGETHVLAFRADGYYDFVAGALSSRPEVARRSAAGQMIAADRGYADYREMAEKEAVRPDGIDVVVIATPPESHLDIGQAFLDRGIDVICEKPFTRNVSEAEAFVAAVRRNNRLCCLTHCYPGYPIVREARAMIKAGAIGKVRMIDVEFTPGEPGTALEPEDPSKRHWRFKPGIMGKAAILGEVGSHAYQMATFLTGLKASRVLASMDVFAERREVYDNAYLLVDYGGGVKGRLWSSYVASGNNQGLSFRIFGDKGSLTWRQEDPEVLWEKPIGGPATGHERGYEYLTARVREVTRFRAGFPEGYGLAFANLYVDFANALMSRELGLDPAPYLADLPTVEDGLEGMHMIATATLSHESGGVWTALTR